MNRTGSKTQHNKNSLTALRELMFWGDRATSHSKTLSMIGRSRQLRITEEERSELHRHLGPGCLGQKEKQMQGSRCSRKSLVAGVGGRDGSGGCGTEGWEGVAQGEPHRLLEDCDL